MDIGVRGAYVMSALVAPAMVKAKNGLIVQISSYGGFAYVFDVGYGVAHAAMDRLSFDMATELQEHNVRAVTLHPVRWTNRSHSLSPGRKPDLCGARCYGVG